MEVVPRKSWSWSWPRLCSCASLVVVGNRLDYWEIRTTLGKLVTGFGCTVYVLYSRLIWNLAEETITIFYLMLYYKVLSARSTFLLKKCPVTPLLAAVQLRARRLSSPVRLLHSHFESLDEMQTRCWQGLSHALRLASLLNGTDETLSVEGIDSRCGFACTYLPTYLLT